MSNLRVAVLYGGPSREHEVSVLSGMAILEGIDKNKYEVTAIFIDQASNWNIRGRQLKQSEAISWLKNNADFVLIGLHGTFGEDGRIQQLLESSGQAFSGSDAASSKLGMHKVEAGAVLRKAGIVVPSEKYYTSMEDALETKTQTPCVVKPASQGSSVGVSIVRNTDELEQALKKAFSCDKTVIIQEYIKGREFACAVVEDESSKLLPLPATELIPLESDFFDYKAKYTAGATNEVTPPEISESLHTEMQKLALRAHNALGCSGYSRTDFIMDSDSKLYIIELNTLPGLTETSILPQEAKAASLSFSQLVDLIINAGLRRWRV